MNVMIFGAGAVGLGLASCLIKAGLRVSIVGRPETVRLLQKGGFTRTGIFGDYTAAAGSFSAVTQLNELPGQSWDYVLVAVKSFDSAKTALELRAAGLVAAETRLVLCQNGWGNAQVFAAHFPPHQIFNARIITGFTRPRPDQVRITVHADAVHIGSLFGQPVDVLQDLCEAITRGGIPCLPFQEIEKDLWAKLLYNCALNPLGAIFKVPYGTLAAYQETRTIMDTLIGEIFRVMEAHGYRTYQATPGEYLEAFYTRLVPPTAGHESSMLQDIRSARKTEIDALTGAVVRLGAEKAVETPLNAAIYHMIRFLEQQNLHR